MTAFRVRPVAWDDAETILAFEQQLFSPLEKLDADYVRICCRHFHETSFLLSHGGNVRGYLLAFVGKKGAFCTRLAVLSTDLTAEEQREASLQLLACLRAALKLRGENACSFTARNPRLPVLDPSAHEELDGLGDLEVIARIDLRALELPHDAAVAAATTVNAQTMSMPALAELSSRAYISSLR